MLLHDVRPARRSLPTTMLSTSGKACRDRDCNRRLAEESRALQRAGKARQKFAQFTSPVKQAGLHGVERAIQHFGDLFAGLVQSVEHLKHGPLFARKPCESFIDPLRKLAL